MQDSDEEYEAALERRRLEVEAEKRLQQEEDARLLRALTAQEELPGDCLSHRCIISLCKHVLEDGDEHATLVLSACLQLASNQ